MPAPTLGCAWWRRGTWAQGESCTHFRLHLEDQAGFPAGIPQRNGGHRADGWSQPCPSSHNYPPLLCTTLLQSPLAQRASEPRGGWRECKAAREEGDPWASMEMPVGCAQQGSAAMNVGVKCHMLPEEPHAASHRQCLFHIGHWCHLNSPVTAEDPPCRCCGCVHAPSLAAARGSQSFPSDPHSPPGPAAASQLPARLPGTTGLSGTRHITSMLPCTTAPPATCTHPLPSPIGLGIKTWVKTQHWGDSQAFARARQPPKLTYGET